MSCRRGRPSRLELRLLSQSISNIPSSTRRASSSILSIQPSTAVANRLSICLRPPLPPPPTRPQSRQFRSTPTPEFMNGFVETLRAVMPRTTKTYMHYGISTRLATACMSQAEYTIDRKKVKNDTIEETESGEHIGEATTVWHKTFNLLPTFSTWVSISFLHAYLLSTRVRALALPEDEVKTLATGIIDTIFYDMEVAMDQKHHVTSGMIRQRFLKQYFEIWRGTTISYDEGLVRGDAVLAAAVWRNIFKAADDVDARHLAKMVAYIRATLADLDRLPDAEFMGGLAETTFGKAISNTLLAGDV